MQIFEVNACVITTFSPTPARIQCNTLCRELFALMYVISDELYEILEEILHLQHQSLELYTLVYGDSRLLSRGFGSGYKTVQGAQKRVPGNASCWSLSPVNTNRSSSWAGSICRLNPFSQLTSTGCEDGRRIQLFHEMIHSASTWRISCRCSPVS